MKKTVSLILVLVLVLALSASAFADFGIVVTKHPTDETRAAGETAWFVSGAQYYSTVDWSFVDPTGNAHTPAEFRSMFPYVTVEGEYTTTLKVGNLTTDLNGWAVFCSFHSNVDNASTNWAFFHVTAYAAPSYAPQYYGYYPWYDYDDLYDYDDPYDLDDLFDYDDPFDFFD